MFIWLRFFFLSLLCYRFGEIKMNINVLNVNQTRTNLTIGKGTLTIEHEVVTIYVA